MKTKKNYGVSYGLGNSRHHELMQAWFNSGYAEIEKSFGQKVIVHGEAKYGPKPGCMHNFQTYIGFTDAFKFCTICDAKEELPK